MLPITKTALSLGEIADHWSGELPPPWSWQKVLSALESAWWLGELRGNSGPTRLQRLKSMFISMRDRNDLGIVFIVCDCAGPVPVELPDGSLHLDRRHEIRVPSNDTENWDEGACSDAFHALAKTSSKESYPELTVGFILTELSYAEFITWCTKRGFFIPAFWKPRDERKTWQIRSGCVLSASEIAVLNAINQISPDGTLDHKANARDKRIQDWLKRTQQSTVSSRTIQRTLEKIHFV